MDRLERARICDVVADWFRFKTVIRPRSYSYSYFECGLFSPRQRVRTISVDFSTLSWVPCSRMEIGRKETENPAYGMF